MENENNSPNNIQREFGKKPTKLCKHCRSEIDIKAGVCPYCRKKQGANGCLIAVVIVIAFFIFQIFIGAILKFAKSDKSSSGASSQYATTNYKEEKVTEEITEEITETEPKTEASNISIVSHSLTKNKDDRDILIIEYAWTNTADKAKSFTFSVNDKVFQNGIECSDLVFIDDVDTQQQLNDVQPGVTYNLKVGYILQDMTNAEVIVTDLYGKKTLLDEIIDLGGGEGTAVSIDENKETSLTITNHYLTKDYNNKDVLIVEYEFYNGEDEATAFSWFFDDKVFQNGIECDDNVFGVDEINTETQIGDIQPGVTVRIIEGYHISDMSNVTVKVKSLFGNITYLSETLPLV